LPSSLGGQAGPYQCTPVDLSFPAVPQAIAAWGNNLYIVDTNGSVWGCTDDTCSSFTQMFDGAGAGACDITASNRGLYWSVSSGAAGINHMEYDGGLHGKFLTPNPQAIAATNGRFAWTSGPASDCHALDLGFAGSLSWSAGPTSGPASQGIISVTGADLTNVAFADDGGSVAWTQTGQTLQISALVDDGGSFLQQQFDDAGATNLRIASDTESVFMTTEAAKKAGELSDRTPGALKLTQLVGTNQGLTGAPVFAGNGLVYWSDTLTTLTYCSPAASPSCSRAVSLQLGAKYTIAQIAATTQHIFFMTKKLYRIEPLH
jgi:hypothetical protein